MVSNKPLEELLRGDNEISLFETRGDLESTGIPVSEAPRDFAGHVVDIGKGVLNGIEEAVEGTVGLGYSIFGQEGPEFDIAPNPTGVFGGIAEGISQFLTGFIPFFGVAGKVGKLGTAARTARQAQRIGKARSLEFIRASAAGALTDFTVFDGHEERLSNMIQKVPFLENGVTEFLATQEDDTQIEGRLRATLEGFLMGSVIDGFIGGLRYIKSVRNSRAAGRTPQETAERAVVEATSPEGIQRTLDAPDAPIIEPSLEIPVKTPDEVTKSTDELLSDLGADPKEIFESKADFSDPGANPRKLNNIELLERNLTKGSMNLQAFKGPDGHLRLMRAGEALYMKQWGDMPEGLRRKTFDEMSAEALEAFRDLGQFDTLAEAQSAALRFAKEDLKTLEEVFPRILAYRKFIGVTVDSLEDQAAKVVGGTTELRDQVQVISDLTYLRDMIGALKGFDRLRGQSLVSNKIPIDMLDADDILSEVGRLGGERKIRKLAQRILTAKEGSGAAGVTKLAAAKNMMNATYEYWINAVLSGPQTHVINTLSGVITSVMRPTELLIGGAISADKNIIKDAMNEFVGLYQGFSESMRFAKVAFKENASQIDPHQLKLDTLAPDQAISAQGFGLAPDSLRGNMINQVGRVVNLPSRGLLAMDEFFKQINARSVAYSFFTREAMENGIQADEIAQYVSKNMEELIKDGNIFSQKRLFKEGLELAHKEGLAGDKALRSARNYVNQQAASSEKYQALAELSLDRAREVTFTEPLGDFGRLAQQAVNTVPLLKFFLPFVRTPINILKFSFDRMALFTDIPKVLTRQQFTGARSLNKAKNKLLLEVLSPNKRIRADAIGRFSMAYGLIGWAGSLAYQGRLTGRGPASAPHRKQLEQSGWLPYSFRTEDGQYVQFRRGDPIATILGTVADITDYLRYSDETDYSDLEKVILGLITGLTANFTNKSYVTGLQNAVNIMSDAEGHGPNFIQRLAGSFVPAFVSQGIGVTDDVNRDVTALLDGVISRTPGMSTSLPPMRDLFGQEIKRIPKLGEDRFGDILGWISPIAHSQTKSTKVNNELANLKHGFSPPRKTKNGIKLHDYTNRKGQNAYDRWMQLSGEIKIGNKTLRQAMEKLISSRAYQKLPTESTFVAESPRIKELRSVVNKYRRKAYEKMLKEFPELAVLDRQNTRLRLAKDG